MAETMVDEFGVRKIYLTNTHPNRAKPWLLGITGWPPWRDRRYRGWGDWSDYSISTDNNIVTLKFETDSHKGRFPVLALRADEYVFVDPTGLPWPVSESDQSKLRKIGYMGTKEDWKNVEVTLYWKVEQVVDGIPTMALCARGGPHHSNGGPAGKPPCWGTCYITKLDVEGWASVTKELGHPQYTGDIYSETSVDNLMHRWIGMKGVFYTKANGNPKIELWIDKDANNDWGNKPFLEYEDDNGWLLRDGVDNECGGDRNEQITWGGPGIIFKLADLSRVDMKWASVREIIPPEGWPLKYLLRARGVVFPVSMRSLAEKYGLTVPISVRELIQREAELYPFR
jgi:hypothetical protein